MSEIQHVHSQAVNFVFTWGTSTMHDTILKEKIVFVVCLSIYI